MSPSDPPNPMEQSLYIINGCIYMLVTKTKYCNVQIFLKIMKYFYGKSQTSEVSKVLKWVIIDMGVKICKVIVETK
jgi:hypothetical protein